MSDSIYLLLLPYTKHVRFYLSITFTIHKACQILFIYYFTIHKACQILFICYFYHTQSMSDSIYLLLLPISVTVSIFTVSAYIFLTLTLNILISFNP